MNKIILNVNDTHVSGHFFLKILKTPLTVPELKMDIQLEYFEEIKRYEKNIHWYTDTVDYGRVVKTYTECLRL
jgi:hypothetical protein